MLDKILGTSEFVICNAKHVEIVYDKANESIEALLGFDNVHYLAKVPYAIYDMDIRDIVNFLLIYDSIDFSFWGSPKWTIDVNGKKLDGGIALLHCVFGWFEGRDSVDVFADLENMTLEEFKEKMRGNVNIPLLQARYEIITEIARVVNEKMNHSFYDHIKLMRSDQEIFNVIVNNFSSFEDVRTYKGKKVHFCKLAQLLTSDILHVMKKKEKVKVDYSNLLGCADYKIPQVMRDYGILKYDDELASMIANGVELRENSEYEVEIRASVIVVINYLWNKVGRSIDRIDINDFIWGMGQDKSRNFKPYHLTRTNSY